MLRIRQDPLPAGTVPVVILGDFAARFERIPAPYHVTFATSVAIGDLTNHVADEMRRFGRRPIVILDGVYPDGIADARLDTRKETRSQLVRLCGQSEATPRALIASPRSDLPLGARTAFPVVRDVALDDSAALAEALFVAARLLPDDPRRIKRGALLVRSPPSVRTAAPPWTADYLSNSGGWTVSVGDPSKGDGLGPLLPLADHASLLVVEEGFVFDDAGRARTGPNRFAAMLRNLEDAGFDGRLVVRRRAREGAPERSVVETGFPAPFDTAVALAEGADFRAFRMLATACPAP